MLQSRRSNRSFLPAVLFGLLFAVGIASCATAADDEVVTEPAERDKGVVVDCTGGPGTGGVDNCSECNQGGQLNCCKLIRDAGFECIVLCDEHALDPKGNPLPELCK